MVLAFGASQHLFDVVETPDETGTEIEAFGAKFAALPRLRVNGVEAGTEQIVDHGLERAPPSSDFLFDPHRHIIVQRQRRSHTVMVLM